MIFAVISGIQDYYKKFAAYILNFLLEILELYLSVKFGLDSSHTHGDGPLHVHVFDLGQHGGVTLQVTVVVPADQD